MKLFSLSDFYKKHFQKRCYVLGDSHTEVFGHVNTKYAFCKYDFDITLVGGATAQGIVNPNSQTNCLEIFSNKINKIKNKNSCLIFLLGEVDTGFVIWYRAEKYLDTIEHQFEVSVNNYISFLREVSYKGFKNIYVMSAPLPTIQDNQDWGEIANLRREVKATQLERTQLTIRYNKRLAELCNVNGFTFMNFDDDLLDMETGLVKKAFLNKDPNNHHLDKDQYAAVCYRWISKNLREKA